MNTTTLPTTWDLSTYFFTGIDDPAIEERTAQFKAKVDELAQFRNRLADATYWVWSDVLTRKMELGDIINPVFIFLSLLQSKDTQNQEVNKRKASLLSIVTQENKKLLFIDEEFRVMGEQKLRILAGYLPTFAKYLNDKADTAQYLLLEMQEQVLTELSPVTGIFTDLYSELTNSFMFTVRGFEDPLTMAQVQRHRESSNPAIRQAAVDSIQAKFGEKSNQIVLGNLYKAVCKKNIANMRNRGIESVMFMRNNSEDMEDAVVNALLDQVAAAYPLYHRFLKAKAKLMGQPKLAYYDLAAPIPGVADKEVSFEDGVAMYLDVMKGFDEEHFYAYSKDMLDSGRVDVYPAPGKRSGAFAQYDKGIESMVLLNYTNTFGDVMTLAHELGHAIHGKLAQAQHRYNYHAPLCLAETASIFNEQILFDSFYPQLADHEKTYYTVERLTDIFGAMFRQVMYVRFERRCHESFQRGEELTYTDFNAIWLEELALLYGDAVDITPEMAYGWSSIPHIYRTPFYCYAYSFGMTVSFALYNMYRNTKPETKSVFLGRYKHILASGGSRTPKDVIALYAGIDITQPAFYQNAFDLIESMIVTLEA